MGNSNMGNVFLDFKNSIIKDSKNLFFLSWQENVSNKLVNANYGFICEEISFINLSAACAFSMLTRTINDQQVQPGKHCFS